MTSSSNLVDNIAEGIHKVKCKYGYYNKKCETCEIKYNFEYIRVKDDLIEHKCLCFQ